jgi:putative ABC transport system ATP-binding protein
MGPSGSGKSTLLHILGFLDKQTGGEYFFESKKVSDYTKAELAHLRNQKMGFVFQSFNLSPRASVLDNVKLPLLYSEVLEKDWDKLAKQAIKAVGLSHRLDHKPSQLSGGEGQRTAIARALVNSPEIVFADEPTGNLDSKSGKSVLEILNLLNQQFGHTIILVTHNKDIAGYAKRIITLMDGKIESDIKNYSK